MPTDPIDPQDQHAAAVALDTPRDATNRGIRTAIQVLLVGLVVDIIPHVLNVLDDDEFDAGELGKTTLRAFLGGILAVAMRYYTPPPAPQD